MSWNRNLLRAKCKALATHVSISALLVGIALALMLLRWFPSPLFVTDGGGIGLKLLLLVDLVLGPLLTFVVFNPGKPRRLMVLDLSVIAVLQLGAYGYGLSNIHSVRVQAVAFHEGAFHAVTAQRYEDQSLPVDAWQALGTQAPYLVNVREPKDGYEASGVVAFGLTAGLEPYELHYLYQPLDAVQSPLAARAWSLAELQSAQPAVFATAQQWLASHAEVASEKARFYRVEGFYGNAVLVFDGQGSWQGGFEAELPVKPSSSPSPRS